MTKLKIPAKKSKVWAIGIGRLSSLRLACPRKYITTVNNKGKVMSGVYPNLARWIHGHQLCHGQSLDQEIGVK